MKKTFIIISLLFLHCYICIGQSQGDSSGSKIEAVRKAFMTKELQLTPEELEKFWPVYNNYFSELRQARKQNMKDEISFEEKAVEIRKRYKGDFKKILNGDDRVNRLFVSEKKLKDLFKKELQNRQRNKRFSGKAPVQGKQKP